MIFVDPVNNALDPQEKTFSLGNAQNVLPKWKLNRRWKSGMIKMGRR